MTKHHTHERRFYLTYSLAFAKADILDENLVQTFTDFKLKVGDSHLICGSQHKLKPSCSQANKPQCPWRMTMIPQVSLYE